MPLKKKIRRLSVQPGLRGSNDLRVGRKMANFQLFFQSGPAKDLSAHLYKRKTATWSSVPVRGKIILFSKSPDRLWGPRVGTGVLPRGVKGLRSEDDHSPSSTAEVKNEWSHTPTPPTHLHVVDWDSFTFMTLICLQRIKNISSSIHLFGRYMVHNPPGYQIP